MSEPLARVDSGIEGLSTSPTSISHPELKHLKFANRIDSGFEDAEPPEESDIPKPLSKKDSGFEDAEPDVPKPPKKVDSDFAELSLEDKTKKANELEALDRIDEGVAGLSTSPPKEKASHRRASSSVAGVASIKELKESKTEIEVAKETLNTGWKINTSPLTIDDKDILKKHLVTPAVRAIELHFKHGVVVTARNRHGVTLKDAMDAIFKPNKKRSDDELDEPYLKGFEWLPNHPQLKDDPNKEREREMEWDRLYIHLSTTPGVSHSGGGKKKKNKNAE